MTLLGNADNTRYEANVCRKEQMATEDRQRYPEGLLDWSGDRAGGVKKLFYKESGRPAGDVVMTSLLARLRGWAQDLATGKAGTPRFVFLVGGPEGTIAAKASMTRRQWVSLLEAVLRIGTASHVLWLCDVNDRIWGIVRDFIKDGARPLPISESDVATRILTVRGRMLSFGHPAVPTLRDYASKYLLARLGLNLTLWALADSGVQVRGLDSIGGILTFFHAVHEHRHELQSANIIDSHLDLQDREGRTITCKKGVGANLVEFTQYTLGQRQTMDGTLRGYDQGYFLRKRGGARNSPWILALGPAAVLAMAHCCLHEVNGPRSVQRLAKHLGQYGIEFDLHGLNDSDLGRQLRMLGLVLDTSTCSRYPRGRLAGQMATCGWLIPCCSLMRRTTSWPTNSTSCARSCCKAASSALASSSPRNT